MPRRRKKKLDFSSIIGQSIVGINGEDWLDRYRRMTAASYTTATTVSYVPATYVLTNYNTDGTFTYTWR